MSTAKWETAINPKVLGTWNLHTATHENNLDAALDFFLLTSSISGSIGYDAAGLGYCL